MSSIAQRVLALPPGAWQQIGFLLYVARTSPDVERIKCLHRNLDAWIGCRESQPQEPPRSTLDAILALVPEWRKRRSLRAL